MKSITILPTQAKLLVLLAIVAVVPLSTAAFGQFNTYESNPVTSVETEGLTIAPEEPDVLLPGPPFSSDVYFDGNTHGWLIINQIAYESDINISGAAYHLKDGLWQLDAQGTISAADRHATLELSGFVVDDILVLHGRGALDTGEPIRVFLRGTIAPTLESGVFALAFTHAGLYGEDTGVKFPLMQTGQINVYPIIVDVLPEPVPLPEPYPEPAPDVDYWR